jgi:hypothetical protein
MSVQNQEKKIDGAPVIPAPLANPRIEMRVINGNDDNVNHVITDPSVVHIDSALGRMVVRVCSVPKVEEPKTSVHVSDETIHEICDVPSHRYERLNVSSFKALYGVSDNTITKLSMKFVYKDIQRECAKMADKDVFFCAETMTAIAKNITDLSFVSAVETLHRLQEYNRIVIPDSHTKEMITLDHVIMAIRDKPVYLADIKNEPKHYFAESGHDCVVKYDWWCSWNTSVREHVEPMMQQINPLFLVIIAAIVAFVCISSSAPMMIIGSTSQVVQVTQGSSTGQYVVAIMAFVLLAMVANPSTTHGRR